MAQGTTPPRVLNWLQFHAGRNAGDFSLLCIDSPDQRSVPVQLTPAVAHSLEPFDPGVFLHCASCDGHACSQGPDEKEQALAALLEEVRRALS